MGIFFPTCSLHDPVIAGFKGFIDVYKTIYSYLKTFSLEEFWKDSLTLFHKELLIPSAELIKQ